jgi:membrane-associated protease RseP (regulator of RpoE activity)
MQTRQLPCVAALLSVTLLLHSTSFAQQRGLSPTPQPFGDTPGAPVLQPTTTTPNASADADAAASANPANPTSNAATAAQAAQPVQNPQQNAQASQSTGTSNAQNNLQNALNNNQATDGAWLGVSLLATTENQDQAGAVVAEVLPGSAAALAGLRPGDIIIRLDNRQIDTANELAQTIEQLDANQDITLTVVRNEQRLTVQVRLDSRNQFFNPGQQGQVLTGTGFQNGVRQAAVGGLLNASAGTDGTLTNTGTTGTADASQILQHLMQLQQQLQLLIAEVQQLRQQLGGTGLNNNNLQNAQGLTSPAQQPNATSLNQALQNNAQTGAGVNTGANAPTGAGAQTTTPSIGTQNIGAGEPIGTTTTVPRGGAATATPTAPQ